MEALLSRPDGWGTPESVELQVLLLVELRHAALGATLEEIDSVNDRYHAYLEREVPGPPTSLAARLGLVARSSGAFVEHLRRFVLEERGVLSYAPAPRLPRVDAAGPTHIPEA